MYYLNLCPTEYTKELSLSKKKKLPTIKENHCINNIPRMEENQPPKIKENWPTPTAYTNVNHD